MKVLFISEALSHPFDEGIKNVAYSLHKELGTKTEAISITKKGNITDNLEISKIALNKLFLNFKLRSVMKEYSPDVILYLPEASLTFNSFLRAKMLKIISGNSKVAMLGVKHVRHSINQRRIIQNFLHPDLLLLLGKFDMDFFLNAGMNVRVLPPAVDATRFCKDIADEKSMVRAEYNVPEDKTVVLHVGHIRSTRNVEGLLDVQKIDGVQVVIVGSTSTSVEFDLKERLEKQGILIINRAISDISRIYRMSDIYVFPVMNKVACIDMPLSVLEASACNLPVITTRFGGLVEHFKEDAGFRYFDSPDELAAAVRAMKSMNRSEIYNYKKMELFTWEKFTNEIIIACGELA